MTQSIGERFGTETMHYPEFVEVLFKDMGSEAATAIHAAVGIAGEAGEVLDALKKVWVYNKELDQENLKEELGDIMFYMQKLCNMYGFSFQSVMQANMSKLAKRYPVGYTDQAAVTRADKA